MTPHELLNIASQWAGFDDIPADSCVVHDAGKPITHALASINATTGDLLLAKQLGCDAYLLHHPLAGTARQHFHKVLDTRMIELLTEQGLNNDRARNAIKPLRDRSFFNDHLSDYDHLRSAAQHLAISLVNVHLPADEVGRLAMIRALRAANIQTSPTDPPNDTPTLRDAVTALRSIRELALPHNDILVFPDDDSHLDHPVGHIAVMHAGGTNAGAPAIAALIDHTTVDTVLYIHANPEAAQAATERANKAQRGGLIVTGHLASDAIGMNALISTLTTEHQIKVTPHSGIF